MKNSPFGPWTLYGKATGYVVTQRSGNRRGCNNPCQEVFQAFGVGGLQEIVMNPRFAGFRAVHLAEVAAHSDDWYRSAFGQIAEQPSELKPIHARHAQIQEDRDRSMKA